MEATTQTRSCRTSIFPTDLSEVVDVVRETGPRDVALFIISTRTWSDDHPRLMHARAATVHNNVLAYRTSLSPLGQVLLAEIATVLSPPLSPAQVFSVLGLIEPHMHCAAQLRTVVGLTDPAPSIFQHALSWWPTSRFIAMTGERVWGETKAFHDPAFTSLPAGGVLATGTLLGPDQDFLNRISAAWKPAITVPRQADPKSFWGSPPVSEVCYAPSDIRAFSQRVLNESHLCAWCAEPFFGPACPLCSPSSPQSGADK